MASHLRVEEATPAHRAEAFLCQQQGVVEALAWETKGAIVAKVVILDEMQLTGQDLQMACRKALGAKNAPRMILIERIQKPRNRAIA